MEQHHIAQMTRELGYTPARVEAVLSLLEQGATIPFIARYRKEATGSLDEVGITSIRDRMVQLAELDSRRQAILKSLEHHGHLTDELRATVMDVDTMAQLEDLYLPYRPKRRTKATIAREKGLAPLAQSLLAQGGIDPPAAAAAFIDPEKGVATAEEALAGARDIIAETINEDSRPARPCGSCLKTGRSSKAPWRRARNRRAPNTRIISTGRNRPPRPLPTESWPCAAVKRKTS